MFPRNVAPEATATVPALVPNTPPVTLNVPAFTSTVPLLVRPTAFWTLCPPVPFFCRMPPAATVNAPAALLLVKKVPLTPESSTYTAFDRTLAWAELSNRSWPALFWVNVLAFVPSPNRSAPPLTRTPCRVASRRRGVGEQPIRHHEDRPGGQIDLPSGGAAVGDIRVGLHECGYYRTNALFDSEPRNFAVILLAPETGVPLARVYRRVGRAWKTHVGLGILE